MSDSSFSALLLGFRQATASGPLDRKLLVCPTMGEGRELLRAAAVQGISWLGWEVTTPRRLALDLAGPDLAADGATMADRFDEEAAVDHALDAAMAGAPDSLRELAETPGFRTAVAGAVSALRLAGIGPDRLAASPGSTAAVTELLTRVLGGYEAWLRDAGLVDTATVLDRAARVLGEPGAAQAAGTAIWLVPGLTLRGVAGLFVEALQGAGARTLRVDPVVGLTPDGVLWREHAAEAPLSRLMAEGQDARGGIELDVFGASGPSEEVREVIRRVMQAGLRWDQVEIVATDPVVYGGALHALARRLGIEVSYAVGLPVERTRPGRATAAYLRWIQSGHPAETLRRLLEGGDLRPPTGPAGTSPEDLPTGLPLARRLRRLRVGRGADRYLPAVDRRLAALDGPLEPRRYETAADAADRRDRERAELMALRSLLSHILGRSPRLDPADGGSVAPAEIAAGLRAFLELVPEADSTSATARGRLLAIADRIAARLTRPTRAAAAVAIVQRHLEIRVPAPNREGSSPWISAGGHLHLTDLEHGGSTGRPATFIVGLDAERFPGAGLQDPLLQDAQRRALSADALPTSADRLAAKRFRLAALLAGLRGRVTLSYSAWDPTQARMVAPAGVLLQAHRFRHGTPGASFEDLDTAMGGAASAVPTAQRADLTDVWLGALQRDGVLLDGVAAVRAVWPSLARGLDATAALTGDSATAHHGLVAPRPDRLDPRRNRDLVLSATGLQDLGTCGRRYFYKYVLGVRPPDDPDLDPDRWLDAMTRGSLLHAVYERTLREARDSGTAAGTAEFAELALGVLEEEADALGRDVPSPGAAIRGREMGELREDVRSFARMMEGIDHRWAELELRFGLLDTPPAPLDLAGGRIHVRGAIDRIDRADDGLVVIDYKTGSNRRFETKTGAFHGGRRLQNVIYAAVAEALLGTRVDRMEYHFPTRRGQNEVISYDGPAVRRGLGLVDRLLDMAAAGRFLPTDSGDDCRFCDYSRICRHRFEGWSSDTPLADWAKRHHATMPEYEQHRDVRAWEDSARPGDDR